MVLTAVAGVTLEEAGRAVVLGACITAGSIAVVKAVEWASRDNEDDLHAQFNDKKMRELYAQKGGREAFIKEMDARFYRR